MGGKRGQVHRPGLGTGRISRMPPQENVRGSQANVRISNTKEDEANGTGRISRMPPQENVRGSPANVRISNTKEDEAKGDKYIVRDLGRDGSPKCRLRKTSADLRQMSQVRSPLLPH